MEKRLYKVNNIARNELIGFIVTMIGVLVASAMLYSYSFAERKNANRNMVLDTSCIKRFYKLFILIQST